ncbi:MAG TPA: indole-3-glycerol-phosphate synthase TrpC, partial [Desulfobacteraceae bacterium]|nr:indole-3-glycerol-phosphate synthase TrpC [Desulfobacteraceae bacterium]
VLVEVHNEAELEAALAADSRLVGINNRNLNDFTVDLETTFRLQRLVPSTIPVVSESGIATREDLVRLREAGVDAALIGESLMRSKEQGAALRRLQAT